MALRMLVMMMVMMVLLMITVMMVSRHCDFCATFADELNPLWLKLNIFQTDRSRNTRSTLENHNERMIEARMCVMKPTKNRVQSSIADFDNTNNGDWEQTLQEFGVVGLKSLRPSWDYRLGWITCYFSKGSCIPPTAKFKWLISFTLLRPFAYNSQPLQMPWIHYLCVISKYLVGVIYL